MTWCIDRRKLKNERKKTYFANGGSKHPRWNVLGQVSHSINFPFVPHITQTLSPVAWNQNKVLFTITLKNLF